MSCGTPVWDFHVTAALLPDRKYHVRLQTKSGRVFERVGHHSLHELIRIIGADADSKEGEEQTSPTPYTWQQKAAAWLRNAAATADAEGLTPPAEIEMMEKLAGVLDGEGKRG